MIQAGTLSASLIKRHFKNQFKNCKVEIMEDNVLNKEKLTATMANGKAMAPLMLGCTLLREAW